ncbi:fimbrial biogenesis chaperone [Enterobacter bugandensis]|uniref:fimbrial biogenesis chaperone n=1 Tax=Enterobacter bugandensis TaxID=881260 RepID=UPI0029DA4BD4|nr:fimbria/pilus periplasmic chaperone [Enterobacter bugandensis]MDX7626774.1 fimbria/pilus periplasmic chaperone [Enterobacter bugandensis]
MMRNSLSVGLASGLLILFVASAQAAISIDRTRVILLGDEKSSPVNVINHSKTLPYLAQAWMENEAGEKISSPLTSLPPLQRVEKDSTVQIRVTPLADAERLPQDRESLFYFVLQEIPPKSDKVNAIQLALRIKVKTFYRPASLKRLAEKIWQEQIRLEPGDQGLKLVNPTPFFVILPEVVVGKKTLLAEDEALTLRPKGEVILPGVKPKAQKIVLKYINDYGAYQPLNYSCTATACVRDQS